MFEQELESQEEEETLKYFQKYPITNIIFGLIGYFQNSLLPNMIFGFIVFEQMCSNNRGKWVLRREEAYSGNINISPEINLIIVTIQRQSTVSE